LMDTPPTFAAGQLAAGVPPSLEAVVFKALAKKADDRYQSVTALREDLDRVTVGQEPSSSGWWRERLAGSHTLVGAAGSGTTPVLDRSGSVIPTLAGQVSAPAPRGYATHWRVFALVAALDVMVAGFVGASRSRPHAPARLPAMAQVNPAAPAPPRKVDL